MYDLPGIGGGIPPGGTGGGIMGGGPGVPSRGGTGLYMNDLPGIGGGIPPGGTGGGIMGGGPDDGGPGAPSGGGTGGGSDAGAVDDGGTPETEILQSIYLLHLNNISSALSKIWLSYGLAWQWFYSCLLLLTL